jgi:hypothetical protein
MHALCGCKDGAICLNSTEEILAQLAIANDSSGPGEITLLLLARPVGTRTH